MHAKRDERRDGAVGRWLDRVGRGLPACGLMAMTMLDPCGPAEPAGDGSVAADSGNQHSTDSGNNTSGDTCGSDQRNGMICQQVGATCQYVDDAVCPGNHHTCWCTEQKLWACTDVCN